MTSSLRCEYDEVALSGLFALTGVQLNLIYNPAISSQASYNMFLQVSHAVRKLVLIVQICHASVYINRHKALSIAMPLCILIDTRH